MKELQAFIEKYGDLKLLEGTEYKGSLYLEGCTSLTHLPENLTTIGVSLSTFLMAQEYLVAIAP